MIANRSSLCLLGALLSVVMGSVPVRGVPHSHEPIRLSDEEMRGLATDILGKAMRDGSRPLYRLVLADSAVVNGVLLPQEAAIDAIEGIVAQARVTDLPVAAGLRSKSQAAGREDSISFVTAPPGRVNALGTATGQAGGVTESPGSLRLHVEWSAGGQRSRELSIANGAQGMIDPAVLATIDSGGIGSGGLVIYRAPSDLNRPDAAQSTESDKSFIHQPIFQDPYISRLTRSVTQEYLECDLLNGLNDAVLVNYQQSPGSTPQPGLFLLDGRWQRIVYAEDGHNWVKSWGDGDPLRQSAQRNLRNNEESA